MSELAVGLGSGDDLTVALEGVLSLVAGLTSVAGHLLIRAAQGSGTTEEQELQSLRLLYA